MRSWEAAAVAAMLLMAGGCASSEAYGVFGGTGEVYTGQMSGNAEGQIVLDNGRGTRCVGEYSGRRSVQATGGGIVGVVISAAASAATSTSTGRALVTCSDGQQAVTQFTSTGLQSGYGFGTTRDGQPVRLTYGMTREQSASYLQVQPGSSGGAPSGPSGVIGSGTGFFITRQGLLLTNAHVVERCPTLSVTAANGQTIAATVTGADKTNDLALLSTSAAPPSTAALRGGRPVRQGEAVVAYGFPLSGALSSGGVATSGSVSALQGLSDDSRYLQMSAPVQPAIAAVRCST